MLVFSNHKFYLTMTRHIPSFKGLRIKISQQIQVLITNSRLKYRIDFSLWKYVKLFCTKLLDQKHLFILAAFLARNLKKAIDFLPANP